MNELQIFENPKFGEIRTITEDGKTLFCAKDVAVALGYKDTTNAIKQHCKGVVKRHLPHPQAPGKTIEMNFIPEGDIYRLAAKSELPGAEEFEIWIFDDVLPSIQKHGAYMTPGTIEKLIQDPDTIIQLATALKAEQVKRKALEVKAEEDRPKVLFADSVTSSPPFHGLKRKQFVSLFGGGFGSIRYVCHQPHNHLPVTNHKLNIPVTNHNVKREIEIFLSSRPA